MEPPKKITMSSKNPYKDIWTALAVATEICQETEYVAIQQPPADPQTIKKRKRPVTVIDEYVPKPPMTKDVELEIRAGRLCSNGHFDTSVPASIHNQLYALFPKTDEDVKEMQWFSGVGIIDECHDYFYDLPKHQLLKHTDDLVIAAAPEDTIEVRDRVRFVCAPGATTATADPVKHVIKRSVMKADFRSPGLLMDMRLALAVEYHVPDAVYKFAKIVPPKAVRIKRTHTYQYVSRDMSGPTWNYVFSWCWSGATRSEAETKLRLSPDNPTSCELEIECISASDYKQAHQFEGHAFVAESILRKMINLLVFGVTEHENIKFDTLIPQQFIRYQVGRAPMYVLTYDQQQQTIGKSKTQDAAQK